MTLDDAFARYWLEHVCKGTSTPQISSADDIRTSGLTILRLMSVIHGQHGIHLDEVTNNVVAQYCALRRSEPVRNRKPKGDEVLPLIGPKSVNNELDFLRAVVNRARTHWGLAVDPKVSEPGGSFRMAPVIWNKHRFETPDSPKRTITPEMQAAVMAWCYEPENLAYVHVADLLQAGIWCPLRRQNLTELDWSQVDMSARVITAFVKSKKPGGRRLTLPIVDVFWLWLANRGPQASGRVFQRWNPRGGEAGPNGRKLGQWEPFDSFKKSWATVKEACDLGEITFHEATRKTSATRLINAGGSLVEAQRVLGHSEITTTMDYVGVTGDDIRSAMNRSADVFAPAEKPAHKA